MYGQLLPMGGGDPIPLLKTELLVGRRESCDICLRFGNVSAHHCQLECKEGYWFVTDLNSRNGVKVNGKRVQHKRLDPGDRFSVAKHQYQIDYNPTDNGAIGPPPSDDAMEDIMSKSLLQRAGLEKAFGVKPERKRYDAIRDTGGKFKDPERTCLTKRNFVRMDDTRNFSHMVYFTLQDSSPEACAKLVAACKQHLTDHPGTLYFAAGVLADTTRPVNDRDFHVALHLVFQDRAAHDAYQAARRHDMFIAENKDNWKSLRVFDAYVD